MGEARRIGEVLEEILAELRRANDLTEERMRDSARDVLYTPSEAAEYMGKTVRTLGNYASRGFLHKVVRGGRQGYLKSEMDRVIGR